MAIYGDEKHNVNEEYIDVKPTFTVSLTFTDIDAKDPLSAVKKILKWIEEDVDVMIYDVTNEVTNEKFTVDLSEDDENVVLPNNG